MSTIVFASVGMTVGKSLKVDSEGYHYVRLGSFNVWNSSGEYYPLTNLVKEILSASSDFTKTIREGKLYGELEHPEFKPGMTAQQFIRRNLLVKGDNLSHHFKNITLIPTDKVDSVTGDKVYDVFGWVLPFGPHKQQLIDSLASDSINTAFSLRCLYRPIRTNGRVYRDLKVIITYDFVTRNGVDGADKFAVGRESEVEYSLQEVQDAVAELKDIHTEVGAESDINRELLNEIGSVCDGRCVLNWK